MMRCEECNVFAWWLCILIKVSVWDRICCIRRSLFIGFFVLLFQAEANYSLELCKSKELLWREWENICRICLLKFSDHEKTWRMIDHEILKRRIERKIFFPSEVFRVKRTSSLLHSTCELCIEMWKTVNCAFLIVCMLLHLRFSASWLNKNNKRENCSSWFYVMFLLPFLG